MNAQPTWWPAALQRGLVQGDAPPADDEPSAWLIALALLGAQVCAVPIGGMLALLLGDDIFSGSATGMGLGLVGLAGALVWLRATAQVFAASMALVLWCLSIALLLTGVADWGRDGLWASATMAALLVLSGAIARPRWVKYIMGLSFAVALYIWGTLLEAHAPWLLPLQATGLAMALAWLVWIWHEPRRLQQPARWWASAGWAAFADAAAVGLLCVCLAARAWWMIGLGDIGDMQAAWRWALVAGRGVAVAMVVLSAWLVARRWRSAGGQAQALVLWAGALLALGAWFSPALAVVALVAAGALIGARWEVAVLCALGALWLLGQFYYTLAWPLATKGLGLALIGGLLLAGVLVLRQWLAAGAAGRVPGAAVRRASLQTAWVVVGAALVLGVVNWDVRGKEQVIATGQPVLVPLVPVDPRSLMQGDYMALNFALPQNVREGLAQTIAPTALVRASVDAKGIASIQALVAADATPGQGEVILPLKRLKGRWVLVTDAYFFPEGTGAVFEQAKFGDFRVLPDGRALLVGLADAQGVVIPVPKGGGGSPANTEAASDAEDLPAAVAPE